MDLVSYSVELVSRSGAGFEQTTLNAHDWRVRALELRECIDAPFSLDLTMISDDIDLDVEGLVGASVSVTMAGTDLERIVRGVVTTAQYLGTFDDMVQMRLGVRPSLALADLFERSRVFQALSVPEIVTAVATEHLGEHGSVDSTALKKADYPPRDYCVQFRETDLAFITRILAEEGIASVLHQSQDDAVDEQTLVLTDATPSFRAVPLGTGDSDNRKESVSCDPPVIPVVTDRAEQADTACVTAMAWRRTATPSGHRARTFDWKAPTRAPVETVAETEDRAPWEHGEVFRHSDRRTIEEGDQHLDATDRITKALRQRAQTRSAVANGQSNALGFFAGGVFALDGHPGKTLDRTYLLTHVTHRADCPEADLRAGGSMAGVNYGNRIEAIDAEVTYRPARRKKPQAYGHQTATVVGPPGEEIHTDALGRIQVWMHWDRSGAEAPLDNTCWLRVAQPLAGPGFGTMFLPRVGMQVLVSFVDGDPDRPVCVGCLYDGANPPPYALPEERTKTTLKTRSTPGGDGFNELRFEDAKGSEQVYLHAQRNLDEQVGSAHSTNVGASQSLSVGADQTTKVGADRNITVQGNQSVRVESQPKGGGVPGTGLSTFVVGDIETESKMGYTLTAPKEIRLVCGGTKIEMTPVGITLTAAGGAVLKLDAAVMLTAAGKAAQLAMAQDGKAALSSSLKGKMSVDSVVQLSSMAGANAVLDDKVTTKAAGGAKLELSADATLSGTKSAVKSSGARVSLDANVDVHGSKVAVQSLNGSVNADATGVKVFGTDLKVIGAAVVTVMAPVVKVN